MLFLGFAQKMHLQVVDDTVEEFLFGVGEIALCLVTKHEQDVDIVAGDVGIAGHVGKSRVVALSQRSHGHGRQGKDKRGKRDPLVGIFFGHGEFLL